MTLGKNMQTVGTFTIKYLNALNKTLKYHRKLNNTIVIIVIGNIYIALSMC